VVAVVLGLRGVCQECEYVLCLGSPALAAKCQCSAAWWLGPLQAVADGLQLGGKWRRLWFTCAGLNKPVHYTGLQLEALTEIYGPL
jgi:hypothetical protein